MSLLKNINFVVFHRGSTAAASADVDSTVHIDMSGYEGILLGVGIEETTAGGTTGVIQLHPRHSSLSTGTLTDLTTGAGHVTLTTGDWGKHVLVDVYRPTKRYIGVSLNKTGNASWDHGPIWGIQYGSHGGPITQSSSYVIASALSVSPTT